MIGWFLLLKNKKKFQTMVKIIVFDNSTYTMVIEKEYDRETHIKDIKEEILEFYKKGEHRFNLRKGEKILFDSTMLKELSINENESLCFNFFSEAILDSHSDKLKVLVNKRDVRIKDGQAFLVSENTFYNSFVKLLNRVNAVVKKELIIKFSIILLLVFANNSEIAILIITLLMLKTLSRRRFNFTRSLEGIFRPFIKTIFMFFYTMFVISGDERILTL